MLETTYAHYFATIHAHADVTSTTFFMMGIFNIIGKLVLGNFLDKSNEAPVIASLVGNALMILPYLTLATIAYWHIEEYYKQWVIMGGSPLLSVGFNNVFIATFIRMKNIIFGNNNDDDDDMSSLIAGEKSIHYLSKK